MKHLRTLLCLTFSSLLLGIASVPMGCGNGDTTDESDVSEATDENDVSEATDESDVSEATDESDVSEATDESDVSEATDDANLDDGSDDSAMSRVGSRDCDVLDEATPNTLCSTCQGLACDTAGCGFFPCVDDALVVEGCNADAQCAYLSSDTQTIYCGMFTSVHWGLCGTDMGDR